jgi:phosphate starvation-inducible PhoH-like protein
MSAPRPIRTACSARSSPETIPARSSTPASTRSRSATSQKRYVDAIDQHTITFGIGPAGTGKTYLAMAQAVAALQAKQVSRIILTRPAVEAGERLGFLPGDLQEKVDPYLRPLYDALYDMLDAERAERCWSAARSRSRRSPSCAAARSTTRSSSSTRRRTPRPSR